MFVYSCSIKIHASGFSELSESIFYLLLVVEVFSLQKVVEMLEEVLICWREVRWMWRMKQNFVAQFVQLLKCRLCNMWSNIVIEKNWALSIDQFCSFRGVSLICRAYFSDVMVLPGFRKLQWIRPANSDDDHFLVQVWLQEVLCSLFLVQSLTWSLSVIVQNPLSSHVTIRLRNGSLLLHRTREENTSKWRFFKIFGQFMRHLLTELLQFSNLLQMPNDHRMVDIEFFGNFWCSSKRISFSDCSQLVIVNFWWPATVLLIFKTLFSFAKLLEPPVHSKFVSSSWAQCVVDVDSVSAVLQRVLNLNKKIFQIYFLSNIISIVSNKYKINSE